MPSAMSSPSEPVETASTSYVDAASPRRITEPLPNCFSIWPSAALRAFLRFSSIWWVPVSVGEEDYSEGRHYLIRKRDWNAHLARVSMLFQEFRRISSAPKFITLYNAAAAAAWGLGAQPCALP